MESKGLQEMQHVDAYFKSEDDALDTLIKLKIIGASESTIEEIPQDDGGVALPFIAFAGTGSGTGAGASGGIGSASGVGGGTGGLPFFSSISDEDDISERNTMLSFIIDDHKHAEAISIVIEGGGKVYD